MSVREFASYLWNWHHGWINHLWYMGTLTGIYIFFPLIKTAYDKNRRVFQYFLLACGVLTFGNVLLGHCAAVVLNMTGLENGVRMRNYFNIFNPFSGMYGYSFVYFCLGGLAHGAVPRIKAIQPRKRTVFAVLTLALSCLGLMLEGVAFSNLSGEGWDVVWNGYDTVFTLVNVCAIFVLCVSHGKSHKIVTLISRNTLGIYFMHMILVRLLEKYTSGVPALNTFAGHAVCAAAILLACLLLARLLSRIPLAGRLVRL